MKTATIRITRRNLLERDILNAVKKQINRPNLDVAECKEWSGWDDSGIYYVPSVERYARVHIDTKNMNPTKCELI